MIRMHLEREESEQKVLCSPTSNLSLFGRSSGFDIPRYRLLSTLDDAHEEGRKVALCKSYERENI